MSSCGFIVDILVRVIVKAGVKGPLNVNAWPSQNSKQAIFAKN